jgi:hypothetical protein
LPTYETLGRQTKYLGGGIASLGGGMAHLGGLPRGNVPTYESTVLHSIPDLAGFDSYSRRWETVDENVSNTG